MKKTLLTITFFAVVFIGCKTIGSSSSNSVSYAVDLSGFPVGDEAKIKEYFNAKEVDKKTSSISFSKENFASQVQQFIRTGILNENIHEFDFYRDVSLPKLSYWEYIINQLPDYAEYGYKYDSYSKKMNEKSQLFAFLAYRINRSPQSIQSFFDNSKNIIYTTINKEIYIQKDLNLYVETLIHTYEHITAIDGYEKKLDDIFYAVKEQDADESIFCRTPEQYELYEPILNPQIVEQFFGSHSYHETYGEHADALWFHSFWMRRHREKNAKVVYQILQEIDKHYQ
jgi:hypothetical protein